MLDLVLTTILIVVLPSYMLWRSLATKGRPAEPRVRRYIRSMAIAAMLTGLVAFQWLSSGRSLASLGLALPVSTSAVTELGVAVCILTALAIAMRTRSHKKNRDETDDPSRDGLPQTRKERAVFIIFSLVVGCSWELLYRGYLIWALTPHLILPIAIVVAASAYGLAHGYRGAKMFASSLISALIFTIAFAVTRSLWWLMLLHCGLPLLGIFGLSADPAEPSHASVRQPSQPAA